MRTQQEIIARIEERRTADMFGFEWMEYLRALTAEPAEPLRGKVIKAEVDLSDWKPDFLSDDDIVNQCKDYMEFAWGKANGCRGISANRSIMHYQAWLWLLGHDEFDGLMDDYEFYGKPQLVRICQFLDLDPAQWDDGIRGNDEY